jgi:hypothetical protein
VDTARGYPDLLRWNLREAIGMTKRGAHIELEAITWERVDAAGRASGQSRDQVIEDAVRRSLAGRALATLFERVRQRSDLSEEQATSLVTSEKADMRAEERDAENDLARNPSRR